MVVRLWGRRRRRRGSARIWARVREQGEGDCQGRPLSPRRAALPAAAVLSHLTSSHVTCLSHFNWLPCRISQHSRRAAYPSLDSRRVSGRVVGRHSNQCPWVEWRQIQFVHLTSPIKTTRFDRSVGQLLVCALLLSSAPLNQITSHLYVRLILYCVLERKIRIHLIFILQYCLQHNYCTINLPLRSGDYEGTWNLSV